MAGVPLIETAGATRGPYRAGKKGRNRQISHPLRQPGQVLWDEREGAPDIRAVLHEVDTPGEDSLNRHDADDRPKNATIPNEIGGRDLQLGAEAVPLALWRGQ
jgi:hypothetical protein